MIGINPFAIARAVNRGKLERYSLSLTWAVTGIRRVLTAMVIGGSALIGATCASGPWVRIDEQGEVVGRLDVPLVVALLVLSGLGATIAFAASVRPTRGLKALAIACLGVGIGLLFDLFSTGAGAPEKGWVVFFVFQAITVVATISIPRTSGHATPARARR